MGGKGSKEVQPVVATPAPPANETERTLTAEEERAMTKEQKVALRKLEQQLNDQGAEMPDVLKTGRYRIANSETTKAFYEQQPSSVKMEAHVPKEMEGMTPSEVKKLLTDTEGLNLGSQRKMELAQQWRLFMASDAVQHGLDAGILLGVITAGSVAALRPSKRHPVIILNYFFCAFAVGMISFPMSILAYEEIRTKQILRQEKDMFAQQRADFYQRTREAQSARDPDKGY